MEGKKLTFEVLGSINSQTNFSLGLSQSTIKNREQKYDSLPVGIDETIAVS